MASSHTYQLQRASLVECVWRIPMADGLHPHHHPAFDRSCHSCFPHLSMGRHRDDGMHLSACGREWVAEA